MPGAGLRYSATYKSPYRDDAPSTLPSEQKTASATKENNKPIVTIRGYDDRNTEDSATSRPQAVEQIQLATESKITKEKVKEEEEEWQANLDKWKSARRQRVPERLLSRAEEAKRLMEEEEARQIRKVKTFSEMMQQRQSRQQASPHLGYNLSFFSQEHIANHNENNVHFDEENKENGLAAGHKRLTTADSVDSQSEDKSSDANSEERLGSEGSQGSEERLASPINPWIADSGVDSLSGSGSVVSAANYSERDQMRPAASSAATNELGRQLVTSAVQPRPPSALPGSALPKDETPSNSNEVIIRLSINPSSDIFGFSLTQDGQKVIVESVDEDGVAGLAGLKQGDEVISLNGVLADSPGSVPSSMDLALMTGQLEMVIYRVDTQAEESPEQVERRTNFKMKLAKFCSGQVGQNQIEDNSDKVIAAAVANEVIIEPKLVERRKSQLFIQALQLEQDEERDKEQEPTRPIPVDVPVEEQLVLKRKNSLSKSLAETAMEKKSPVEEIEPQIIERKKAEFIRQASSDNMVRKIDVMSEISVEQHLVLQRKASIENASQRTDDIRVVELPSVAVAQLKASIENSGGSLSGESQPSKSKTPSVDIETTLEERKASFFEHSGTRVERTTVELNIEPKLIEQRKANFLGSAEAAQKTERNLDLDIQPKLIEQRKANFLENATKRGKTVQQIDIEPKTVERKLMALQINSDMAPAQFLSDQRKVELTLNSMQSKPKIEVAIEPDLIRKRKEALFCSSSTTNDIERRRAKLANIEAEVYGTPMQEGKPTCAPPVNTILVPAGDKKRSDEEHVLLDIRLGSEVYPVQSPTDHSESTISEESRSASSTTTTITEIQREVGNAMLSSVASSSLFSPVSERNESPAHLSDLSPDSESAPVSRPNKTNRSVHIEVDSSPDSKLIDFNDTGSLGTSTKSSPKTDQGNMVARSPEHGLANPPADTVSPPNPDPLHRIKAAGQTLWNKEKEKARVALHTDDAIARDGDSQIVQIKHDAVISGQYPQHNADGWKESGVSYTMPAQGSDSAVRRDIERDNTTHQTPIQHFSSRQQLQVEAEVQVKSSPMQEPYENVEMIASGSGEQLYQVSTSSAGNFDVYNQLPSQPPKGIKKGPAPAPPTNMTPYNPTEELYENAPQLNRAQHMYRGPYYQQTAAGMSASARQMVQMATTVTTSQANLPNTQASLQGSQARFGLAPIDQEQMYGDLRRPAVHESPGYNDMSMIRRRENPILRQERKSYHEGTVNYPGYDYMQHLQQQKQSTPSSGYPCTEDIYENTRKYAKSCEDIYANSNQLARTGATTNSHLLGGKTGGELPLSGANASGYGQEIYENVETYAKTRDYLNNLRKPSVAEDFYEAPRVAHEQGRILSASVNKPTLDAIQRSRSQPYIGGVGPTAEPKLIVQRKSADNLPDEPRQLTAELGAKKKPQQDSKSFNANHWLIQEAELRRQLEAQNLGYAGQSSSQLTGSLPVCYAGHVPATSGSVSHVSNHTNQLQVTSASTPVLMSSVPISGRAGVGNMPPLSEELGSASTMPALSGPQRKAVAPQNGHSVANMVTPASNDPVSELGISGKKRCSLCSQELGRGAAMVIESLQLHFHLACFRCCVCRQRLGNGTCGTDVRVRNSKLHCHNCNSYDEAGLKYSRV
ncbi:uncharacterized protein LOC111264468 isoform X4 [Varroa jacobsoni]|uniref:LIM and calponin homology domains-containing protein 1 n=1 Tax=Varroa destructor TaxID=109461 RepID=A0A7M7KDK0_VARDE|nr:uncharacterized protein LOC111252096 isoform X3 [Varroa destructor]XP_022696138.1 uncharacterized protein LOC111264468 isoform X4 [Varroa jacobsoni]